MSEEEGQIVDDLIDLWYIKNKTRDWTISNDNKPLTCDYKTDYSSEGIDRGGRASLEVT